MTQIKHSAALRFALYARVSTEAQEEEGQSLDTQIEMMRSAVASVEGVVTQEYRFQESAMPGSERPSLRRVLKDAADGRFDAVMVCKLDRLSRAIEVTTHVENSLRRFGTLLFEGREQHDLRSAEGSLTRGMQALIGEYSVNRLKWSACASRLERAKRGWPHSGLLPWGRVVEKVKDRRHQDAVWVLDSEKAALARRMFEMYSAGGANFAAVGRSVGMNPETVRRVLIDQSGPVWRREFIDPATGQMVKVETVIPALLSEEEHKQLEERARQNQRERANWPRRGREYPLSGYLRCANSECGWSNLSGHLTYDSRGGARKSGGVSSWAYYLHLRRNRLAECLTSVPAQRIENAIFSRLGQLLASSTDMHAAIRAALITDPDRVRILRQEQAELVREEKDARRVLANAMDVLFEHKGSAAAALADAKVRSQGERIAQIESRQTEIRGLLRLVEIPEDFSDRFSTMLFRLTGMHGHVPMHWPTNAKRALLRIFFAGGNSTRFDRVARGVRSGARGIFVTKAIDASGEPFWTYEARGVLGDLSGALTDVVALHDKHFSDSLDREFSAEELTELAALTPPFKGLSGFRSSSTASRRWSASMCRGTFPPER